jgi:hypothetical protein
LDPKVYKCIVGFVRRDGEELSDDEVAAIKAALASEAAPAPAAPPASGEAGEASPVPPAASTGTGG